MEKPVTAPEDVQLDVEARELESAWEMLVERGVEVYTRTRVMVDRDAYGRAERAVTSLLALLRRVSGKGAQEPRCITCGKSERYWKHDDVSGGHDFEAAPVPATPEPRYTAKEIISLIHSPEWEEEFMQADDESYVAFITGKLAQMTTQGTLEGAK